MRIVHVLSNDAPGGLNQAAIRLHEGLLDHGIDSLLCLRRLDGPRRATVVHGPRSFAMQQAWETARAKIDAVPVRVWSGRAYLSPSWVPTTMHRTVARLSPDVVHVHQPHTANLTPATLRRFNAPVAATLHDMWFLTGGCTYASECRQFESRCGNCPKAVRGHAYDSSRLGWLAKRRHYPLDKMAFVAPSRWMQAAARQSSLLNAAIIYHIPYGIDLEAFPRRSTSAARARFGVPGDSRVIGMIADRVADPRKGVDLGLAVARRIAVSLPPGRLQVLVAGSGSDAAEASREMPWLHHVGQLNGDAVLDFYSALDLLLLPSREDNLPNVGIEASATGTPVLGFDVGGLPDIVVVPAKQLAIPFDTDALANLVRAFLQDETALCDLRARTRQHCQQAFSLPVCVARHLALYESLMSPRSS